MDPLHPITYGPSAPSRRVPPVERLPRVTREGDRPPRDPADRRGAGREQPPPSREEGEGGEGHIDVRV